MRFQIGAKIYNANTLEDLPLKLVLQMQRETAVVLGEPLTIGKVRAMGAGIAKLKTDNERLEHPDLWPVMAVIIWATRNISGEKLSFDEVTDVKMSELSFLPDPQDRLPPQKARPRKGSGPAAARRTPPKKT